MAAPEVLADGKRELLREEEWEREINGSGTWGALSWRRAAVAAAAFSAFFLSRLAAALSLAFSFSSATLALRAAEVASRAI